jgi:hypothetical protein
MATFTGGETIVNETIIESTGTGTGAVYTVPSGRYARISIYHLTAVGSSATVTFGTGTVTVPVATLSPGTNSNPNEFILPEGRSISVGSGSIAIGALALEFNNP